MATETSIGVGIRRNTAYGQRNFEDSGTVQYKSSYVNLWWTDGNNYQPGTSLPFDVGGVSYSKTAVALLLRYWEQTWIEPLA